MTPPTPTDRAFLTDYAGHLRDLVAPTEETLANICATRDLWLKARAAGGKVMLIGNGGSAAIAAHLAIDGSKNAGVRAVCFNDGSQITCLANDYGFENWIAHAIRLNADADDVLVAISSSGRSANILTGVREARKLGLPVVTLSGMQPDNPLRALGAVNFWADSHAYNLIETAQARSGCNLPMTRWRSSMAFIRRLRSSG